MLGRNDPRQLKFCRRKLALASGNPFFDRALFHLALVFNSRTGNWHSDPVALAENSRVTSVVAVPAGTDVDHDPSA